MNPDIRTPSGQGVRRLQRAGQHHCAKTAFAYIVEQLARATRSAEEASYNLARSTPVRRSTRRTSSSMGPQQVARQDPEVLRRGNGSAGGLPGQRLARRHALIGSGGGSCSPDGGARTRPRAEAVELLGPVLVPGQQGRPGHSPATPRTQVTSGPRRGLLRDFLLTGKEAIVSSAKIPRRDPGRRSHVLTVAIRRPRSDTIVSFGGGAVACRHGPRRGRTGPRSPLVVTATRPPGSVRRTSNIDTDRPVAGTPCAGSTPGPATW